MVVFGDSDPVLEDRPHSSERHMHRQGRPSWTPRRPPFVLPTDHCLKVALLVDWLENTSSLLSTADCCQSNMKETVIIIHVCKTST